MGLTLITGGARSGKSTFAEKLARQYAAELAQETKNETPKIKDSSHAGGDYCGISKEDLAGDQGVLYIATAIPFDEEMRERVRKHQAQRPASWRTVEQYTGLAQVLRDAPEPVVLLDCLTMMLSNLVFEAGLDVDHPTEAAVAEVEEAIKLELASMLDAIAGMREKEVVIVSNELGMGVVPAYPLGRIFRDIAGRANQQIAAASDRVYLVVSGIPVPIKG